MNSDCISDYISPQMNILNMVIPIFNASLQFRLKLESCKPNKAARHPTICYIINNDVKLFPTIYRRIYSAIYCGKFFTLSNQTSRYKIKWERSGSVVECLTRDRRVAGSSLTGVTALWSLSKTHLS